MSKQSNDDLKAQFLEELDILAPLAIQDIVPALQERGMSLQQACYQVTDWAIEGGYFAGRDVSRDKAEGDAEKLVRAAE